MIPKDPVMLLSYINTQLRDFYDSLESFCTATNTNAEEIIAKLKSIDYEYDEKSNQFI
ncbi:MAG: DUF4250 domain-containing protein [Clostridiales bacterium]|nr:DUF4250 domain-containing protein [Candidatus Blautia equi]